MPAPVALGSMVELAEGGRTSVMLDAMPLGAFETVTGVELAVDWMVDSSGVGETGVGV